MTEQHHLSLRKGRVDIHLQGYFVGDDLQVTISGGDRPHIGAVAVSFPHPGLKSSQREDVTTSVLTVPGHKEDLLARDAAQRIATAAGRVVTVSCGIHLEQITKQEIAVVQELVSQLVDELIARLS